jgi:hypothetical protein
MNSRNDQDDSEQEIYANTFFYFMRELKILAEDAEKQCEMKQYDNVAWEIKNFFIRSAEAVLNLPGGNLSKDQRDDVIQLLADVTAIPDSVVNVPNLRAEHIGAMNNPCWNPVRAQAKALINLLVAETRRTNKILKIEGA